MILRNIVSRWLQEHFYDGLYLKLTDTRHETECQCEVYNLMGCMSANPSCEPGRKAGDLIRPARLDHALMPGATSAPDHAAA